MPEGLGQQMWLKEPQLGLVGLCSSQVSAPEAETSTGFALSLARRTEQQAGNMTACACTNASYIQADYGTCVEHAAVVCKALQTCSVLDGGMSANIAFFCISTLVSSRQLLWSMPGV